MPKQAGKLNWDESPGASSVHLSHKPATNPEKTCFPAPSVKPQPALQGGDRLQNWLIIPHHKDGNVAAGCPSAGVMTSHGLPFGDSEPAVGCRSQDSRAGLIPGCPAELRAGAECREAGRIRPGMLQCRQDGMLRAGGTHS